MKKGFTSRCAIIAVLIVVGMVMTGAATAFAQTEAPQPEATFDKVINIPQGAKAELPVEGVKRILVGAPNVLDATQSDSMLRLYGKQLGTTLVALWTEDGRTTYQVRVVEPKPESEMIAQVAAGATAQEPMLPPVDITLEPGESYIIKGRTITRTAVGSPDIVDIVPVSATEVLVNAKKEGMTTVRVWDARGQSTYNFTVARKQASPEEVAEEITRQIGISTISARVVGETVVLAGTAPNADMAHKAGLVAEAAGRKVINLVTVEAISAQNVVASLKSVLPDAPLVYEVLPDQTIMIRGTVPTIEDARRIEQVVQTWVGTPEQVADGRQTVSTRINFVGAEQETPPEVVDRARTVAKTTDEGDVTVGTELNFSRRVFGGRIPNGPRIVATLDINPALARQILVSAQVLEVDRSKLKNLGIQWGEILGPNPINPLIFFEDRVPPIALNDAGPFRRNDLTASVRALITEDAARVLSQPKLLITDGHAANILVGGEIPIPVAQSNTIGSVSITVEYKPFGIQLTVRPRITPDGRILLTLTPEVSSLDFANAVRIANFEIPALRTRRATTTVHMSGGESLAIGGLLSSEDIKTIDRVPLLSRIPIIGELFKSRRFDKQETELIILVTPQVIERGMPVPIEQPSP